MGARSSKQNLIDGEEEGKRIRWAMKKRLLDNINMADLEGMQNKQHSIQISKFIQKNGLFKEFDGKTFSGEHIKLYFSILDDIPFEEENQIRDKLKFWKRAIGDLKKNEMYSEWAHSFVFREREYYEILTINKRCFYCYIKSFQNNASKILSSCIDSLTESNLLGIIHNFLTAFEQLQECNIWPSNDVQLENFSIYKGIFVLGDIQKFEDSEGKKEDNRGKIILNFIEKIISNGKRNIPDFPKIKIIFDHFLEPKTISLTEFGKYVNDYRFEGKVNLEKISFENETYIDFQDSVEISNIWEIVKLLFSIGDYVNFESKVSLFENVLSNEKSQYKKNVVYDFYQFLSNSFRFLENYSKASSYHDLMDEILSGNQTEEIKNLKVMNQLYKAAFFYNLENYHQMEYYLIDGMAINQTLSKENPVAKILYGIGFCLLNEIKGYRRETKSQFSNISALLEKEYNNQPLLMALIFRLIGDCFFRMGETLSAEFNYKSALQKLQEMGPQNHPHKSICKRNYGMLLLETGDINQAFFYLEQALDEFENYYTIQSVEYIECLNCLGYAYLRLNKRKAEDLFKISLEFSVRYLGKFSKKTIECMNNIGALLLEKDKPNEALTYFKVAYSLAMQSLNNKNLNISKFKPNVNDNLQSVSSLEIVPLQPKNDQNQFISSSRIIKPFGFESQEYFVEKKKENFYENTLIITLLNNVYTTSTRLGLNIEKQKNLQEAFRLCKHLKNTHNTDLVVNALYSNTLLSVAQDDMTNKRFRLSFERVKEAIHIFNSMNPGNPSRAKALSTNMANISSQKPIEIAIQEGEKMIIEHEKEGKSGILEKIELNLCLANICSQTPIYSQKGINILQETEKLIENHLSKTDILWLRFLNVKASCHISLQFYDEANKILKEVLKTAHKLKMRKEESVAYSNLGLLNFKQNNLYKAEKYFHRSLEIKSHLLEDVSTSNTYNNLGNLYIIKENYEKALINYFQALKIRRECLPLNNTKIWSLINNLSACTGHSITEENFFSIINDILEENELELSDDKNTVEKYCQCVSMAAKSFCRIGKYDLAKKVLQKAISFIQEMNLGNSQHFEEIKDLLNSIS